MCVRSVKDIIIGLKANILPVTHTSAELDDLKLNERRKNIYIVSLFVLMEYNAMNNICQYIKKKAKI